jgi:hypothetical protein
VTTREKNNASEDPPSYTKVDGYPPSSWDPEASSNMQKKTTKKSRKEKGSPNK